MQRHPEDPCQPETACGRAERLARDAADQWAQPDSVEDEQSEVFLRGLELRTSYAQTLESVAAAYYREGKEDYVRVLYNRLCQNAGIAVAKPRSWTLPLRRSIATSGTPGSAWPRPSKKAWSGGRLSGITPQSVEQEFQDEWQR